MVVRGLFVDGVTCCRKEPLRKLQSVLTVNDVDTKKVLTPAYFFLQGADCEVYQKIPGSRCGSVEME